MATTKVFKSGNSAAVRLPKDLDLIPGTEVEVTRTNDGVLIRPAGRFIKLNGIIGSLPGFMSGGRDDVELPKRDWPKGGESGQP